MICNIDAGHHRPTPEQTRDDEALRRWKLDFARTHGMEALCQEQLDRKLVPAFVLSNAAEREAYVERYRTQPLAGYLGVGEALPWREPWLENESRRIPAPVCIIAGDADPIYPGTQALHGALPGSRFVTIDNAPHDSMNASPAAFNTALLDFLETVDS